MRKPLLSLVAVALVAAACSSGTSSSGGYARPPDPPQHHQPTSPPKAAEPAQTPYDDVTFQDPGATPPHTLTRTRSRPSPWISIPPRTRSPNALSPTATSPILPVSASRNGSTPSTRTTRRPRKAPSPSTSMGRRPRSSTSATCCSASASRPVTRRSEPARTPPSRSSSTRRGRWPRRIASSSSRIRCGSWCTASATAIRSRSSRSVTMHASSCHRPVRPTRNDPPAIDGLEPGGSTNLEAGLRLGYDLARETHLGDGIDRVILASDGVANVGLTDADGDPAPDP